MPPQVTIRVRLSEIRAHGDRRPPGYAAALEAAGEPDPDGLHLRIGAAELEAVKERFGVGDCPDCGRGLGDLVHRVAGPIGKALHYPCNERDADGKPTAELRPGSPCDRARSALNRVRI